MIRLMSKRNLIVAIIAVFILIFLAVFFVKNNNTSTPPSTSNPSLPQSATSSGQQTAPQNQVTIKSNSFNPDQISIKVGDTVTWVNNDSYDHTVVSSDRVFDSGNITSGANFSFTFTKAGTFPYHCSIHPFMQGSVMVSQ